MTQTELETLRAVIRLEVTAIVKQHLIGLTVGCIAPLTEAVAQIQETLSQISDGQLLVEKHLASQAPDDNEPWRQSLDE